MAKDRQTLSRTAYLLLSLGLLAVGCRSPYRADQGAALGGLLGAGTGAIIGNAVGDTGAGALIGAGVGALSGAVVGSELDEMEAQNRAEIEARMGRQIAAGSVTVEDVVAMSRAGVSENVVVNHVRIHGSAQPLQTADLIYLQQQGVSSPVIQAMQTPPVRAVGTTTIVRQAPPVVVVDDPWCHYPHWHYRRHYHRPSVSWGLSFNDCH